jgi:protein gp37
MAETTEIGWTDGTFNPWWGCTRVSPACAHCYADFAATRFGLPGLWEDGGARKFFGDKHWNEPKRWNAKAEAQGVVKKVFCASMADVFEPHAELAPHRERLWGLIEETPWLAWQLLTKRPENIMSMIPSDWRSELPRNVWVGTSVENSRWTERAEALKTVPAAVRFLSCEPLLGSLFESRGKRRPLDVDGLDWIIVGGESGPQFRPLEAGWVREVRDATLGAELPFFFKQWGGATPKANGKEIDGVEWCQVPEAPAPVFA